MRDLDGLLEELREADLAHRYAVSKSPVRDALQRLRFEGLVETEPRRGHPLVGLQQRRTDLRRHLRRHRRRDGRRRR